LKTFRATIEDPETGSVETENPGPIHSLSGIIYNEWYLHDLSEIKT